MATGYEIQMYNNIQRIADALESITKANVAATSAEKLARLRRVVDRAEMAAERDSTDDELEYLKDALAEALALVPGWNG